MAKNIIFEIPEPHIAQQDTKGLRVFVKVSEKKKTANYLQDVAKLYYWYLNLIWRWSALIRERWGAIS